MRKPSLWQIVDSEKLAGLTRHWSHQMKASNENELIFTPLTKQLIQEAGSDLSKVGLAAENDETATLVRDIANMQLQMYIRTGATEPWIGYIASRVKDRSVIGSCSFVGPPRDGFVEIAYFTFPHAEGRGFAGLIAAKLVSIAKAYKPFPKVFANTLPEYNASTSVLVRLGFAQVGDGVDEEVGRVWRWEAPNTTAKTYGHE